jgi:hypothetical protein
MTTEFMPAYLYIIARLKYFKKNSYACKYLIKEYAGSVVYQKSHLQYGTDYVYNTSLLKKEPAPKTTNDLAQNNKGPVAKKGIK